MWDVQTAGMKYKFYSAGYTRYAKDVAGLQEIADQLRSSIMGQTYDIWNIAGPTCKLVKTGVVGA